MIERIFHPVGQGAFYSERHILENQNFNIVYDCGSNQKKNAEKVVTRSFNNSDVIDILFISHFDFDHVCLVEILKNNFHIKKVVLPLLHEEEVFLLSALYNSDGENALSNLVSSPASFFEEETDVVFVRATETENDPIERETISSSNLSGTIESGTAIKVLTTEWVYIPFNYDYKNRNQKLKKLFIKENIDIKKLKNDTDYLIKNRAKIRDIYLKIKGGVNQNSMLVYSGPVAKNTYRRSYHKCDSCSQPIYYNRIDNRLERVACVYTGDSNLNRINLKNIYITHWAYVGTIQIPHHGDFSSFNESVLSDKYYCCPISYGKNSYGHPSTKVVNLIKSYSSIPIHVTLQFRYSEKIMR